MTEFQEVYNKAVLRAKAGEPANKLLTFIAQEADKLCTDRAIVSILLLDKEGLLRNGASPSLPADYLKAIDGIKPNPNVGTCAAVAATGEMIFTPDFYADGKWDELRHLPLSIGYRGAWSLPIKNAYGKVLGTFGTYYKTVRVPSEEEIAGFRILAEAVSEVLAQTKEFEKNIPSKSTF
jgi:GAF domain-containing protein